MKDKEKEFTQALHEWADETAEFYHKIATSDSIYDLAFYTQSNLSRLTEQVELLILGINPGSGSKYFSNQIENELWKDWGIRGKMDGITLLKGNPCFHDRDKWRTWQGLKRIFSFGKITDILNDEQRFAWSNIIFFNEPKEHNIRRELYQLCPEKTLELIKILKPKRILCLSIRKCFDVLNKDIKDHEMLIDSFLERGKLLNIPIYSIRHTSYGNIGEKLVGESLKYLFDKDLSGKVSKEKFLEVFSDNIKSVATKTINPLKEETEEIVKICVCEMERNWQFHEKENNRFAIARGYLSLTITSASNGYVAIRYMENNKIEDSAIQSNIMDILSKYNFSPYMNKNNKYIWLGIKKFKDFSGNSPIEVSDNIISEVAEMVSELESLYS